ncbi:MAG: discoidin domain-containing protein [Chitinophagaceae bacterium]|nr:discoidin domain-containing protein [Chitinophagaceae bacterium]
MGRRTRLATNQYCGREERVSYSSSGENGGLLPENTTDGNYGTRWASEYGDNRWIYIDQGQPYDITEVKLFWEAASDFNIEVSNDAFTCQLAVAMTNNAILNVVLQR